MTDLSPTEEQKSLEMFDGVLSRNLGLEVVVVLTKTDSMTSLEAEHGLSDQHFDFIQQSIRWRLELSRVSYNKLDFVAQEVLFDLRRQLILYLSQGRQELRPSLQISRAQKLQLLLHHASSGGREGRGVHPRRSQQHFSEIVN